MLYALYLFNPVVETNVLREGIYPALCVLVLAGCIGIFVKRESRYRTMACWSGLTGAAFSLFWLRREEAVWLLPAVLLLAVYTIGHLFRRLGASRAFCKRVVLCALPFLMVWLSLQAVSLANLRRYGVYLAVDMTAEPFTAAYGALSSLFSRSRSRTRSKRWLAVFGT